MVRLLEIEKLAFGYRRGPAVLADVNFSVAAGELLAVIGPNGSGKTTLLKLIAGLLSAPVGSIRLNGRDVRKYAPQGLARRLAYVPQQIPLAVPFTVSEFVMMGRAPYLGWLGRPEFGDQAIVEEALEYTGLAAKAPSRLQELSGGELQRAVIAKAICQQTPLMLLDEPTAALDLRHQRRIMQLLQDLVRDKQRTVVMVSHDLNLAARCADRLLLLDKGAVRAWGPPEDVLVRETLEAVYQCPLRVDTDTHLDCLRVSLG